MKWATTFAAILVLGGGLSAWAEPDQAQVETDRQIAELIEQLGDREFARRQRAQQQLLKLGYEAFDALVEAEDSDDPEIALQAGFLVRHIRSQWTRDTDPRAIRQILEDYESLDNDDRLKKIKELSALPDDQGLEWLCRLVRFEKSPVLSKQAALAIIASPPQDEAGWKRRSSIIGSELARARRPAARWLETDLALHADPAATLDRWAALAETEQQTLAQHPRESTSQIVSALLRRQVELLDELGRTDETGDVLRSMVMCERGDSASLTELIGWLVERKSWDTVDLVAQRFAASFEVDAVLMYTLCEARLAQGNRELADATAQRALEIHGDSQQEHLELAERLNEQGLARWAAHEWRHIIAIGPTGTSPDVDARRWLAGYYHDKQRDLEAGDLLRQLVDAVENDPTVKQRLRVANQRQADFGLASLRSDMNFYLACHAAREGEAAEQRRLLDLSLEQNRTNVETIIALYEITGDDPEKRAEVLKCSADFLELCRSQIDADPDNPTFYNQIAWLVANTEGDLDEALELSEQSVELAQAAGNSPTRIGGLLDTLAHCHFAKKDYAAAVRTQEEAARLDTQSQAITRALARFREQLARHNRSKN